MSGCSFCKLCYDTVVAVPVMASNVLLFSEGEKIKISS